MSDELSREDLEVMASIDAAYRPYRFNAARPLRENRLRPWLAAAATVAVLVVVAGIVWRPPSAFATWTSAPTSSDPQALAADTASACRQQAATLMQAGDQADWPEDPALAVMGRLPLVAYDQRGDASAALFADRETDSIWTCAIIPVAGQPPYVELSGGAGLIPEDLGSIEIWAGTASWNWDYGGRWQLAGRVDPNIGQVTIVTEDDRTVIATIDDGWFLAWWPSESGPVRIDLHDADGELLDSIDLGDRYAHEPSCRISLLDRFCLWEQ